MTVLAAISEADLIQPNEIHYEKKALWISRLDSQICSEIGLKTPDIDYCKNPGADLTVPFPYDKMYPYYLAMRIHLEQGDMNQYNAKAETFNSLWRAYSSTRILKGGASYGAP